MARACKVGCGLLPPQGVGAATLHKARCNGGSAAGGGGVVHLGFIYFFSPRLNFLQLGAPCQPGKEMENESDADEQKGNRRARPPPPPGALFKRRLAGTGMGGPQPGWGPLLPPVTASASLDYSGTAAPGRWTEAERGRTATLRGEQRPGASPPCWGGQLWLGGAIMLRGEGACAVGCGRRAAPPVPVTPPPPPVPGAGAGSPRCRRGGAGRSCRDAISAKSGPGLNAGRPQKRNCRRRRVPGYPPNPPPYTPARRR